MKKTYLKIQPIQIQNFGQPTKTANAITWTCPGLDRNATSARVFCELSYIDPAETEPKDFYPVQHSFVMEIPKSILDIWLDDSVIDDFVLTYSTDFIKV